MDEFNIIVENEEPIDVTADIQNDFLRGEKGEKGDIFDVKINGVSVVKNGVANIEGMITKAVNDLENYYLKEEVNNMVSAIPKFAIEVVSELPESNISNTTIYLLISEGENLNLYDEYIYVNNNWEKLGTQTVDLTNYYNKTEIDEVVSNLEEEINTLKQSSVKTYTSKGLNFRFERYGKIVEVTINGQITETVTKDEANDIVIDTDFVPSIQKATNGTFRTDLITFSLIAMTNGTFRWRSNTTISSGWCTGSFTYLV